MGGESDDDDEMGGIRRMGSHGRPGGMGGMGGMGRMGGMGMNRRREF